MRRVRLVRLEERNLGRRRVISTPAYISIDAEKSQKRSSNGNAVLGTVKTGELNFDQRSLDP